MNSSFMLLKMISLLCLVFTFTNIAWIVNYVHTMDTSFMLSKVVIQTAYRWCIYMEGQVAVALTGFDNFLTLPDIT